MKIVYINHSSGIQGAGLALLNIIKGMLKKGVVPIVVLPCAGPLADKFHEMGVKVYYVMHYNAIYPRRKFLTDYILYPYRLIRTLFYNKLAEQRFRKIVLAEQPDIIHSNSGVIRFGAKIAKEQNIPHVWHAREFMSKDFFGVPLGGEKKVLELYGLKNNHCIAITKAVFQHFALTHSKDCVIYDGVFPANVATPNILEKKKYLLFVGSLQKGKGIYDALSAFDEVVDKVPEYELWIAGKDYVNIEHEISIRKNAEKIKYLGFRTDVYDLMANATALLVPSYYEGFGFITVEAMLNKTLVLGRNVAGTKEQFDNGLYITGKEIGIRFNSTKELSEVILQVCTNNPSIFRNMVESAYKVVMDNYTIEKNTEQIYHVYNQVLHK